MKMGLFRDLTIQTFVNKHYTNLYNCYSFRRCIYWIQAIILFAPASLHAFRMYNLYSINTFYAMVPRQILRGDDYLDKTECED